MMASRSYHGHYLHVELLSLSANTFLFLFIDTTPTPHSTQPLFSVQVTERMKIVDVLGVKQFLDGERIITQVRLMQFHMGVCDTIIGMWRISS